MIDFHKEAREIVWLNAKHAFVVICPRCNGFECGFCEGTGSIYPSEEFKKMHDNLTKAISIALQSAYNRAILDAARLAENECEYDLADSICQLKQESL